MIKTYMYMYILIILSHYIHVHVSVYLYVDEFTVVPFTTVHVVVINIV